MEQVHFSSPLEVPVKNIRPVLLSTRTQSIIDTQRNGIYYIIFVFSIVVIGILISLFILPKVFPKITGTSLFAALQAGTICISIVLWIIPHAIIMNRIRRLNHENQEQLFSFIDRAREGVFIVQDGMLRYVNTHMAEMVGYTPPEVIGTELSRYSTVGDAERMLLNIEAVNQGKEETSPIEYTLAHRNGNTVAIAVSVRVIMHKGKNAVFGVVSNITERKNNEKKLRESEEKYRSFIGESSEGMLLTDENGVIIETNSAFRKISGCFPEDIVGRNMWDFAYSLVPPENRGSNMYESMKSNIRSMLVTGGSKYFSMMREIPIIGHNGVRRVVQQNGFPIKTAEGFRIGMIIRDITGLTQAKISIDEVNRALELANMIKADFIEGKSFDSITRDTCDNFRRFFSLESVSVLFKRTDKNGHDYLEFKYNTLDPSVMARIERLLGMHVFDIRIPLNEQTPYSDVYDHGLPREIVGVENLLSLFTSMGCSIETALRRHMRLISAVLKVDRVYIVPLIAQGKMIGHFGFLSRGTLSNETKKGLGVACEKIGDIFEKKQVQTIIEDQMDFMQTLIEVAPIPIFYKDREGKYLGCNRAFANVLGRKKEDLVGQYDRMIVSDELPKVIAADNMLVEGRQSVASYEIYLHKEQNRFDYIVYKAPFSNTNGEIIGVVGAMLDITEHKRLEYELQHSIAVQTQANKEQAILLESAIRFVEISGDELYEYIGKFLKNLVGGGIVVICIFDEHANISEVKAIFGLGEITKKVAHVLGKMPIGLRVPLTDDDKVPLLSKRLITGPRSLFELTRGSFPKTMCEALDALLGIETIYGIGFSSQGKLFGHALIFKKKDDEIHDVTLIETFISQASIAMQRNDATKALHDSEQSLHDIVDFLPDAMFVVDTNGTVMRWNKAMEMMTGISSTTMIGKGNYEYSLPFYGERRPMLIDFILSPDLLEKSHYEYIYRRQDRIVAEFNMKKLSGITHLFGMASPLYDHSGKIIGAIESIRDITEQKGIIVALEESEQKYRTLFDSTQDGFVYCDINGIILDVNVAFCSMVGYSKEELLRRNYKDLIPSKWFAEDEEAMARLFTEEATAGMLEKEFMKKDGTAVPVLVKWWTIFDEDGNPNGLWVTVIDMTERKQQIERSQLFEEKLRQADKMKSLGILVSGVAHEINNPNQYIISNIAFLTRCWESARPLLDDYLSANGDFLLGGIYYSRARLEIEKTFTEIAKGSKRIGDIIEELKGFARKGEEIRRILDINAVVRSSLSLISGMIKKSTKNLIVTYDDRLPGCIGIYQRIEQVIINIVQNACQALSDINQRIDITTGFNIDRNMISIVVHDDGVGIPHENLDKLATPFFTTKRERGGTGLGLSISMDIIKEHGGAITFDSTLGKGTTVTIWLPQIKDKE
ncbi:MAG: PAS domain S-box protein [Candidatus Omnitrophica bacterium]|nr:PAS domain S-box protein [Candidatus Omnitrophota bacterium]